jgi:hypothetical protein
VLVLKATIGDCPACGGKGLITLTPTSLSSTGTRFIGSGFGCYLCNFEVTGPEEMAALQKTDTPLNMTGVTELIVSYGPTLTPEEVAALKAKSA